MTSARSIARDEKIESRCAALAEVLTSIRPFYQTAAPDQQSLIETMIGAAIWYIPKPYDAWTGQISIEAIKSFLPDYAARPRLSEEHAFPRKQSAIELLMRSDINAALVSHLFKSKYGRLHYLTPLENKTVIRFQRSGVFTSSEEAYRAAGIRLVTISVETLRQIKARDPEAINATLRMIDYASTSTDRP